MGIYSVYQHTTLKREKCDARWLGQRKKKDQKHKSSAVVADGDGGVCGVVLMVVVVVVVVVLSGSVSGQGWAQRQDLEPPRKRDPVSDVL